MEKQIVWIGCKNCNYTQTLEFVSETAMEGSIGDLVWAHLKTEPHHMITLHR